MRLGRIFSLLLFGLLLSLQASAQSLLPNAQQTFLDANGVPLAGGQVFTYIPNSTTPKTTYQDSALTVPNANPIILDAAGRATIWGSGFYREIVKNFLGVQEWDLVTSTGQIIGPIAPSTPGDLVIFDTNTGRSLADSGIADTVVLQHLANNAALNTAAATVNPVVIRDSFATLGDAPPAIYRLSQLACPLNAGSGDGGAQVQAPGGKCWLALPPLSPSGVDPRQWGLVDSGTVDNTAPIQAALNYACTTLSGARVVLPPFHNFIKTTATLTLSCGGVSLEGQAQGTTLAPTNTGFDTIQMTSNGNAVRHLRIIPAAVTSATFAINCVATTDCVIDDVQIANAYNGIHSTGSVSSFRNFKITSISTLGIGLLIDPPPSGDTAATVYNCFMENTNPATAGILISAGVNATDIALCDIIKMGTDLSINSGVGKVTTSITANQSFFDTSGGYGVAVVPQGGQIVRLRFSNVWFGSNTTANFALVNLGGTGGSIAGLNITNYENYGSAANGFEFDNNLTLNSIRVCDGSNAGNVTAFFMGAGDGDVEICNSEFGPASGFPTNGTHVFITAGAGDFIKIHDNTFLATSGGPVLSNSATGIHNVFHDNPGYNPLGVAVITPGASPWTYTAGPNPETHYLNGGTVSSIKVGGAAVFTTTPATIQLGPNESFNVTYTVAPTDVAEKH